MSPDRREGARHRAARPRPLLLWLVVLSWLAACATDSALDGVSSASTASPLRAEARLEALLASRSPADFLQAQRGLDMARFVEGLGDWSAVRLGALGPLPAPAAERLNRKRAAFLVASVREDGPALAEVFALFVLHSTSDEDLRQVLRALAEDKRLGRTLGHMPVVAEQLRRRGLPLTDFADRPEHPGGDVLRGASEGLAEVVSSTPLLQWGAEAGYDARKRQLPAPYQEALTRVEESLVEQALAPGTVAHGVLDELTFGVPLGAYALAAATGQGLTALSRGEYERATRELTPAALMVVLYAGGKGLRGGVPRLQTLDATLRELKGTARRLRGQLGEESLDTLARYLQADSQAAFLVAETGEAGALALHESGGNVSRARAWLSQASETPPRPPAVSVGVSKAEGTLSREVLDAKVLEGESGFTGPRLSADVAGLREQLAASSREPPPGATSHPLWSEYVRYTQERLSLLERGAVVEPPLRWEGYQRMRGLVTRGLAFERAMTEALRAEAALPRSARRYLTDFEQPRVEQYVGVWKPGSGLRFVDVLVLEERPLAGQPPRVETFSFKSRDLSRLRGKSMMSQMIADAREALHKYGETLDIRRDSLRALLSGRHEVRISRVRLIYEGEQLSPNEVKEWKSSSKAVQNEVPEVEVLFQ